MCHQGQGSAHLTFGLGDLVQSMVSRYMSHSVERGALGGATSDHESTNEGRIDAGNDYERITKSLSGCAKSMEPVAEKYM